MQPGVLLLPVELDGLLHVLLHAVAVFKADPHEHLGPGVALLGGLGERAFYWFSKAADGDHITAVYHLGHCCARGTGTRRDMPSS